MTDPYAPPLFNPLEYQPTLNAFLFTFSAVTGGRATVQAFFDQHPEYIKNWISTFEGTVIVASDRSLQDLGTFFRQQFPTAFFFVTEVRIDSIQGWAPKEIWEFIWKPRAGKPAIPGYFSSAYPQTQRLLDLLGAKDKKK